MIGIANATYALARERTTIAEWCATRQLPELFAQQLAGNGAQHFHRVTEESLVHLGRAAIVKLLQASDIAADAIDAMVLCQTSPCNVLPMPYTLVGNLRKAARLSRAYVFSIAQQQCVSPLHALRALTALFDSHRGWRYALVVGVDTILREELRAIGDAGIHSDGAGAMLIERDGPNRILSIETYNDARLSEGIRADGTYEPNDQYLWTLISVIRRVAKAAGVPPASLTSILPHNVNLPAWRQALDALRIPQERLFSENFGRVGHVFSSDAAMNLADSRALHIPGKHLVFASGIGGTFGGFLLDTEQPA
jgi:3-oxoacyl-[acyl-carrier-protein] synthase-3